MRGTEDLLVEQRPPFGRRKRKLRGRAQPYRRNRLPGPTLTAMLKGAPMYLPNPIQFRRDAQKRRR